MGITRLPPICQCFFSLSPTTNPPHSSAKIDIRPSALPLRAARRHAIRVLLRCAALDGVHRELTLELALERREQTDEVRARLLEDRGGCDAAVRLDLQEEVRLERVGDLVAREEDGGVAEELSAERARRGLKICVV